MSDELHNSPSVVAEVMSWHKALVMKVDDLSAKVANLSYEVETTSQFCKLELRRVESSGMVDGTKMASLSHDLKQMEARVESMKRAERLLRDRF